MAEPRVAHMAKVSQILTNLCFITLKYRKKVFHIQNKAITHYYKVQLM